MLDNQLDQGLYSFLAIKNFPDPRLLYIILHYTFIYLITDFVVTVWNKTETNSNRSSILRADKGKFIIYLCKLFKNTQEIGTTE